MPEQWVPSSSFDINNFLSNRIPQEPSPLHLVHGGNFGV